MNRLKYIFLLCFLSSIWQGYAQQLPIVSQYDINKFFYNPAFAGSEGYTSFDFIARQQWLGFQQAPSLQLLSFQTRLKSENNAVKSISSFESDDNNSRNGVGGF